ncbi:MAG: hypothetical protein CMD83_18000 [Gammaproteobacteria bacterium]|nr:hypothetical protein [Gammaproteobacteria bacterium]
MFFDSPIMSQYEAQLAFQEVYKNNSKLAAKLRTFEKSIELLEHLSSGYFVGLTMKNSGGKTQIQITTYIIVFKAACSQLSETDLATVSEFLPDAEKALKLFLGVNKTPKSKGKKIKRKEHKKMVEAEGIVYEHLSEFERDKGRLFYENIPERYRSALEKVFTLPSFKEAFARVILSTGTVSPEDIERHPELVAHYMLWGNQENPDPNEEPGHLHIFRVEDIISEAANANLTPNKGRTSWTDSKTKKKYNLTLSNGQPGTTTLNLGPLQIQKKGSGEGGYNGFQSNASVKDVLEQVAPIYSGDISGVRTAIEKDMKVRA